MKQYVIIIIVCILLSIMFSAFPATEDTIFLMNVFLIVAGFSFIYILIIIWDDICNK